MIEEATNYFQTTSFINSVCIRDVQALLAFPPAQNSPGAFVLKPHYKQTRIIQDVIFML